MENELKQVQKTCKVIIRPDGGCMCGNAHFNVIDHNGKFRGSFEIGRSHGAKPYREGIIKTYVEEILKVSLRTIHKLQLAARIMYAEIDLIEQYSGIHFYVPNALPIHNRVNPQSEKQLLIVTTEYFEERYYSSSEELTKVWIPIVSLYPGKTKYKNIYRFGDLIKIILTDNQFWELYLQRVEINVRNQKPNQWHSNWIKWQDISNWIAWETFKGKLERMLCIRELY